MGKIIVLATPVFLLLIAIELAWGVAKGRNTYRLADAVSSISLGMMSQFTAVFTRLLRVGVYTAVYTSLSVVPPDAAQQFWNTWYGWFLALVFYDFCYYWLHRLGHESAILWAAHAVHHQSQDYNLSTALRQTSSGALLGWIFYVPMALAGVPPAMFGIVALVDLLYQFWVHTEHVPKLGWFDRWFCSPSNHRVHHAVNDVYLDKNYGGIWVVWDRLFGSFMDEDARHPCVYGTRSALQSWDPLWANVQVYASLCQDAWHARNWADKLRVFVKRPGWRPADVAARFPRTAFDIAQARAKFDTPQPRPVQWLGLAAFALLLQGVAAFLWFADSMPQSQQLMGVCALAAALWAVGALMQGRFHTTDALAAWLAISMAASYAMGWLVGQPVVASSTLIFAIILIAACARKHWAKDFNPPKIYVLLIAVLCLALLQAMSILLGWR